MERYIMTSYISSRDGEEEIEVEFFEQCGELFSSIPEDELDAEEFAKAWAEAEREMAERREAEYVMEPDEDWFYNAARERATWGE